MPRIFNTEERAIHLSNLELASSAPAHFSQEEANLAHRLSAIHGTVRVTREDSGLHFYMASPECLQKDGRVELTKMHLAVNVDKYLRGKDSCAMCMKTGKSYRVSRLLRMPALAERGIHDVKAKVQMSEVNRDFLEQDASGNWVPKSPGKVVSILELPQEHPAIFYLQSRGFEPRALWEQFRLSYCYESRNDIFYRRLLNGFKASPLGRIVFYIDQQGINRGWQARILDYVDNDIRYYFHPSANQWMAVEQKIDGKWCPLPTWENWDSAKYIIGHGAKRNQCLLGYDAAVASNLRDSKGRRYCILVEGPLDAGRLGPPAIATMGKFFSKDQAKVVSEKFERVICVPDNDKAGQECLRSVIQNLDHARVTIDVVKLPSAVKDVGELSTEDAWQPIAALVA